MTCFLLGSLVLIGIIAGLIAILWIVGFITYLCVYKQLPGRKQLEEVFLSGLAVLVIAGLTFMLGYMSYIVGCGILH